jgi:hypothetical protein
MNLGWRKWRHDIRHNDTHHTDTRLEGIQHNNKKCYARYK